MKTKLKQKGKRLFALMLSIVMVLGMIPATEAKAAETISMVSATTIPLLAGTNMKDVFNGVTYDDTKMTLDQVVIYDVEAAAQWDSKTCAETYNKFVEGKDYTITLVLNPREGYSFAVTAATINGITAVIEYQSAGSVTFTCEYTVPEATVVENVDITVADPNSGEAPNYNASVAEAQKDMVSVSGDVYWGYGESGSNPVASNGDGTFVKEREYTVRVTLKPGAGYKLTEDTICTINGNPATFDAESSRVSYQYPPLETELLQTVSATCNLIHGTKLSEYNFGIPEDAGYEVDTVAWYEGVGSSASSISSTNWDTTTIDETKTYTLEFNLKAKEGYGFTDATTFTVNIPEEATVDLTLARTFKTKKIKVLFTKKVVGKTNITLPLPVVGEPLPTAVSDNENCIVYNVGWELDSSIIRDPNYIVEEGKTYVASIALNPSARYSLWDTDNLSKTEIGERITLNHANVNEDLMYCNLNGRILIYTIYMESHSHDYAAEWSKDEAEHWHECTVCGDKKDVAKHAYDGGKVTKEATETLEGVKTYTCTVCGMTKTETIPATGKADDGAKAPSMPDVGTKVNDKDNKAVYKVTGIDTANPAVEYTASVSKTAKTVTIPATVIIDNVTYKVTSVAKDAFKNNKKITTVTIGSNVKTIGANAFFSCKKLTKVTLGKNVTTIGDKAFYKCTALTKITIPSKVSKIGKSAFYGCKKLKTITIKTAKLTGKKVGSNAFKGIYSKVTIMVPKSKLKVYTAMLKKKGIGKGVKVKK